MDVKKAAAETKDYIVSIRREFHRHPAIGETVKNMIHPEEKKEETEKK